MAAMREDGERFAVTLAPRECSEEPTYRTWGELSRELALPVMFGVGINRALADVMRSAAAAVTTSVAEGFGLCFLEPWSMGRAVIGRNLPEITRDMADAGVELDHLYGHLLAPTGWIDLRRLRERVLLQRRRYLRAYGVSRPVSDHEAAYAAAFQDGSVDFGRLSEAEQEAVIRLVAEDPGRRDALFALNPALATMAVPDSSVNRQVVLSQFGASAYRQRLLRLYETVVASHDGGDCNRIDPKRVLDAFLKPERFCLLRT